MIVAWPLVFKHAEDGRPLRVLIQAQGLSNSLGILSHKYNVIHSHYIFFFLNSPSNPIPKLLPSGNTKFHKGNPIIAYWVNVQKQ